FCGIGLNGVDFDDELAVQRAAVAEAVGIGQEKLVLVNDGIAALWGATAAPAAAIIQHGSGITSAYRPDYGRETPFDNLNVGRIFDIRHESLPLVARMIDGRVEPTPLKDKLLSLLGLSAEQYAEAVFRRKFNYGLCMSAAPLIFEAYEQHDAAAELLVERAIEDYVQTAAAMVRETGRDDAEVAFGGGTLAPAGEKFHRRLAERLAAAAPEAKVIRPRLEPHYGAAVMAAFNAGRDPELFYDKVFGACKTARPRPTSHK
ncbi:MAG: hypothetical protein ACYTF6_09465, partial [Planctomycetota bacterium]